MTSRKRPMRRIGDLLPTTAAALGLDEELRFARAMASWERLVAELVPVAAGTSRLLAIQPGAIVVTASQPIVAQELRLRSSELLEAFAAAPGGGRAPELRVVVRPVGGNGGGPLTRRRPRVD
jgi:hypothetical protein